MMKRCRLAMFLSPVLLLVLASAIACGTPAATSTPTDAGAPAPTQGAPASPKLNVVATTNIVADWTRQVGGNRVEVFSLVPVDTDPHTFQPGAQDVTRIANADLVLSIGLSLEAGWMKELLENTAADPSSIVELGEGVGPLDFAEDHSEELELLEGISHVVHEVEEGEISAEEGLEELTELLAAAEALEAMESEEHGDEEEEGEGEEQLVAMMMEIIAKAEAGGLGAEDAIEAIEALTVAGEEEHEGHGHGEFDPHFWFDPLRVKQAVDSIAAHLSALDPEGQSLYQDDAAAYNRQLDMLHAWIQERVAELPEEHRLLITSHDSFQYFAELYEFRVVGAILPVTADQEPTAQELAELVEDIREHNAPAVFGESTHSDRLARRIAEETGAVLIGSLYTGSLGAEGGEAGTYLDMMRHNVETIVEGLR